MRTVYSAAALAALAVLSVPVGQAASKPRGNSPATQARIMLEQVDAWSVSVADTADRLRIEAKDPEVTPLPERMGVLRDDVNNIGRELQSPDGERGALPEWASSAVDQVLPLMQEIAADTQEAIQAYNSDRHHLWATSFPDEAAKISEDAQQVKERLDLYLKLATIDQQ